MHNRNSKLAYFLNAVLYSSWRSAIKTQLIFERSFRIILSPFKIFFTKKFLENYSKKVAVSRQNVRKFFSDKNYGFAIDIAKRDIDLCILFYGGSIGILLIRLCILLFGIPSIPIIIAIGMIPFAIIDYFIYKYIYAKGIYLEYFKIFENKDELWHKKWIRIRRLFFISAIILLIIVMCICL